MTDEDVPFVRIKFHLNWGPAPYYSGGIYDVRATEEIRQLVIAGLADLIPYT